MGAGAPAHRELVALDSRGRNLRRRIYLQGPLANGAALCGLCASRRAWAARLAPGHSECLTRRLDNILERFAFHISLQLLGGNSQCARRKLWSRSADMRSEQQVGAVPKRMPFRQWLGICDIECRANAPRIERIDQSI